MFTESRHFRVATFFNAASAAVDRFVAFTAQAATAQLRFVHHRADSSFRRFKAQTINGIFSNAP